MSDNYQMIEAVGIALDDSEAMHRFIRTEMAWDEFRDDSLGDSTSGRNFQKLRAFLERDDCGFSRRLKAAREALDNP